MRRQLEHRICSVVAAVVFLAVGLHFAVTAIYVMPDNPLKLRTAPLVSSYIHPYFEQGWKLFAPDPAVPNQHLAVSCRLRGWDGALVETLPVEVTSALYSRLQAQRIGPAQRLLRTQTNALGLLGGPRDDLVTKVLRLHESDPSRFEDFAARLVNGLREHRRDTLEFVARIASAECDRLHAGSIVHEVRPLWMLVDPPLFSERHHPPAEPKVVTYDLGWYPYQHVSPYWSDGAVP